MTPTGRQESQSKLQDIPPPTTEIGQELKKSFVTPIEFPDVDYILLEAHLVMENFSKICSLPSEVYLRREVPKRKMEDHLPRRKSRLAARILLRDQQLGANR